MIFKTTGAFVCATRLIFSKHVEPPISTKLRPRKSSIFRTRNDSKYSSVLRQHLIEVKRVAFYCVAVLVSLPANAELVEFDTSSSATIGESQPISNIPISNIQLVRTTSNTLSIKFGPKSTSEFYQVPDIIQQEEPEKTYSANFQHLISNKPADGYITINDTGHLWISPNGWSVQFQGSFPVKAISPGGDEFDWDYLHNTVTHIDNETGTSNTWKIPAEHRYYCDDSLQQNTSANTGLNIDTGESDYNELIDLLLEGLQDEASANEELLCDTAENEPPVNFTDLPGVPDSIRIDIRPASCESYFTEYSNIVRGQQIELGFSEHEYHADAISTVNNFPVIDFLEGTEAIALISRDLGSASYNDTANTALLNQLLEDGEKIMDHFLTPLQENGSVSSTMNGETTTINADDVQTVVLELVIQAGSASEGQIQQINEATETLAAVWGIILTVIEIP